MAISIQKHQSIHKVLLVLFYISVFLLPTHFFVVARPTWSYWQGHFIDYWSPKLFVGQLVVWLLGLVSLYLFWKTTNATRGKSRQSFILGGWTRWRPSWIMIIVLGTWTLRQMWVPVPRAAYTWLLTFLTYPAVFLLWWMWYGRHQWRGHLAPATVLAVLGQAFLAAYQLVTQKHLGGYWLMGQPIFTAASNLAHSAWSATVRPLPYGSTPHPNILAGWLVVGIIAVTFTTGRAATKILIQTFFLIILLATESWTAVAALTLWGWWRIAGKNHHHFCSRRTMTLMVSSINMVLTLAPFILYRIFWTRNWEVPMSISRRVWLILSNWPELSILIWGTGWLQSITQVSAWELSQIGTGFLQPAHSVWVLFIIENGIWTLLLLYVFRQFVYKNYSLVLAVILIFSPIFSLDHYFYTTIVGQNLLLLLVILFKTYYNFNTPYNNINKIKNNGPRSDTHKFTK